jgi:hypothetical protein
MIASGVEDTAEKGTELEQTVWFVGSEDWWVVSTFVRCALASISYNWRSRTQSRAAGTSLSLPTTVRSNYLKIRQ